MLENVAFSTDYGDSKAFLDVFPVDNFVCFAGNDDNFFQISVPDNRGKMRLNAIRLERSGLLIGTVGQVAFYDPFNTFDSDGFPIHTKSSLLVTSTRTKTP